MERITKESYNMKKEKIVQNYLSWRDNYIREENYTAALYFQIAALYEIEKVPFSFSKKKDFTNQWEIFEELFRTTHGFYEESYAKGFYYEVAEVYFEEEKSYADIIKHYFESTSVKEYKFETLSVHLLFIKSNYQDREVGKRVITRILELFEYRYGKESVQYAELWLHILAEIIYQFNEEEYFETFIQNFNYFGYYLSEKDFYVENVYLLTSGLLSSKDNRYKKYLEKFEKIVAEKQNEQLYYYFKAKLGYLNARETEIYQKDMSAAAEILEYVAYSYIRTSENTYSNLFYAYIYFKAAVYNYAVKNYDQMKIMADFGLEICEELNFTNTELYYWIKNYKGIYYLVNNQYRDAAEFYSENVKYIEECFGRENENYIKYMNNLALVALREGRISDGRRYLEILRTIKDEKLKEKCKVEIDANLYLLHQLEGKEDEGTINRSYNNAVDSLKNKKLDDNAIAVKINYLFYKIKNKEQLNQEDRENIDRINEYLQVSNISEEQKTIFNFSLILDKWQCGRISDVAKELEEMVSKLGDRLSLYTYRDIWISYIQLLFSEGKYKNALLHLKKMLSNIYDSILILGFSDINTNLYHMRLALSIYIKILQCEYYQPRQEDEETLFEYIVECKTIEKKILKELGNYNNKGEEAGKNIYDLHMTHRKIAALEIKKNITGYREEKLDEYYLRQEELENKLRRQVDLKNLISRFHMDEVNMPEDAICIEYFAYYDLDMMNTIYSFSQKEDISVSYLVFSIYADNGKNRINRVETVSDFHMELSNSIYRLRENSYCGEKEIKTLSKKLLEPVAEYIKLYQTIYWALDFELQYLPFENLYINEKMVLYKWNSIYVDSVCNVQADVRVELDNATSMVMGNPIYNINKTREEILCPLEYSEDECVEISKILKTRPFLKTEANQKNFVENLNNEILHISTHGVLRMESDDEEVYNRFQLSNSFFPLSGFDDWCYEEMIKEYGNGLIMADDFVFTDLLDTKLVVISACDAALGNIRQLESLHGIRWAIGISGAQSNITALWEVDDFASAILMILFYRNLKCMTVGRALQRSKIQLKELTIGEICNDNVIYKLAKRAEISFEDSEYRPFEEVVDWAGFVCYIG